MQSGRVNIVVIVAVAFLVMLGSLTMFSQERPSAVAANFMLSLANMDAEKLTDLSYAQGTSREELLKKWKYTTEVVARDFTFTYDIKGENPIDEDSSNVWMMYRIHAGMDGSFDERFELPMVKTKDGWKVDVYAISRDMFPGLPR